MDTTLDIKDLDSILSKLSLFPKDKWRGFGLKAGLYDPRLSAIEANHPRDVEGCFSETVSDWLKRSDGVDEKGGPTWLRLGDILEEMEEKDLADEIRRHGTSTSLTKSESAGNTKPMYIVPYELNVEYSKMNDRFSFVLSKFADEIIQENLLEDFKAFLLGRTPHQSEGREREGAEIMKVCNKLDLVFLLRKYFFLSNFGALLLFAEEYKFVASQTVLAFSKEINKLYSKILAKDFAKQAIEDHEKLEDHGEMIFKVVWSLNTSLKEFQQFLADAFHRHGILISLRVVHHSLLTFVCTIPKWLVVEMKEYVVKNEEMLKLKKVVELIIDGTVMFSIKSETIVTPEKEVTGKLSGLTLTEQEEFREIAAMLAPASSVEERKFDHSLKDIKRKLSSRWPHHISDRLENIEMHMMPPDFDDCFREFIRTNDEYAELKPKVHDYWYSHDIFRMYYKTIWNCQSYSEVKKFCNLFLKVMGNWHMRHHHHYGMYHHRYNYDSIFFVAHWLKREWEQVLGGEPLVDINEIFFSFDK